MHPLLAPASYLGLFAVIFATGAGLPLPEDAAVMAGGVLVHRGVLRLVPTMIVALAAVLAGDVALYLAGRRFGPRVARFSDQRLARARRFFDRWGAGAVFVARFVMGLRAAVFLSAGTLGMSFPKFLLVNLAGAIWSVPLLVWLGAWGGARVEELAARMAWLKLAALGAVVVVAALVVARRWRS